MKKYQVIYADPPWEEAEKHKITKRLGTASKSFSMMKTKDICNLSVGSIADNNCALFLWTTSRHIPDALEVCKCWGFRFVKVAFTWMKVTKSGKPAFGLGYYTHSNSEYCLLGIKGRCPPINHTISEAVLESRGKIFKKPDTVRRGIEDLYGDVPRIELFAREKIVGWDVWGNQVDSDVVI